KRFSKKHRVHKESVSKQERKFAKGESSVQRDPLFGEIPEDTVDHMETENAHNEGRIREMVDEDKEIDENILSTEDVLSTDNEGVSTDMEKVSTDRPIVSTDGSKVSTDRQIEGTDEQVEGTEEHNEGTEEKNEGTEENFEGTEEHIKGTDEQVESTDGHKKGTEEEIATQATQTSTQTPTSMIFGDDETIATLLLNMSQAKAASKEKEKGVELKDVEEIDRPRPTSTRSLLTLKPLPKIDPKDKGKKKIEEEDESESESDGIPEAEKKFKQLESDEELARKVQEEWEAEEERNRIAEENAANEELIKDFDDIKARIEADRLLAEKLQEQEREQFTIEERAKFLHDTIAAQRKFLAQQRSEAIRNKPPTKNQLRNQMMTYLKHVGNYKHAELKIKKFEEVQALYEKIKRSDEDFISIGSAEDERLIKRMNEKGVDLSKSEVIKEESKEEVQEEDKDEESTRKRKLGTRKKMKSRKRRYIQNTSEDDSDKENDELRLYLTIAKEGVSTDFEKVSTDRPIVSTDGSKVSTDEQVEGTEEHNEGTEEKNEGTEEIFEGTEEQIEGTEEQVESTDGHKKGTEEEITPQATQTSTQTPTSMIFGDDETIAKVLLNMSQAKAVSKEKEKGVELKDVEETDRPRPTSTRSLLTLKPLPKIDPKDKGKKKIEEEDESESEDDDIPQAVKKFKQLESDEEMARKIQEEWEAEEERNKIAEEKATNEALIKNFDDIKARIEADRILAEKLQEQEREQFTIEERAKFLHDTIAAQRKFLAQQRSEAIRNRPPTKNQLRNQMMTYLKHVGNFKHSELKSKKFKDIQAMYEKIKRSDEDFIAIGSVEDDRLINKMNKKDSSKGEEIKQESKDEVKEEDKGEENTRKRKHGTRKKMKSRKRRFKQDTSQDDPSDIEKENDELRLCLTIAPDEDKEVDYEILDKKYPIIDWKTENLGTKPQFDESKRSEEINMNVVTRSNGQKRSFSTLIRVLSVFDREDLDAIYKLVMDIYQDKIPEGFDKVLWGDLIVMFNPDEQDEFWNSQHEWKVVSWKLHSSSGVHTLMTDEGLVVHMLIEKKYPLKKEILMQMLKLKLESEEESTMALELIRFIKKSWLVQDQTVLGKDYSNLLIADSLLKTIWFINAPCYDNEALASPNTNDEELSIPEQTATGKGTSNPLMAGTMAGVDVDTLTMEQYLALSRENQAPGVVKPEIGGNVNFEIKSQFMREFREDTFSGNKDEDAHDHIDQVDRLAPGTINTWDLFKKAFIQGYCPPSMTTKQLEIFTTLSKKETNHYIKLGSDIITCYTSALPTTSIIIQRTTSKKIESSSSNDGLAALVGFQICKGPRLDKDFTLNEEVKQVEEIDNRSPYGEKRQSLEDLLAKHQEESTRRSTKMKGWIKKLQENAEINTRNQNASLKNLETQIKQLTKEIHSNKILNSSSEQIKTVTSDQETSRLNKLHGVSFISGPESNTPEILQHQLPPKELTPRSFTLPCTIDFFTKVFNFSQALACSFNQLQLDLLNNSGVRVLTFSRFITKAEKSNVVSVSSSNDSRGSCLLARLLSQDRTTQNGPLHSLDHHGYHYPHSNNLVCRASKDVCRCIVSLPEHIASKMLSFPDLLPFGTTPEKDDPAIAMTEYLLERWLQHVVQI
ncbi:hypothetical protein Tco_0318324, partial [Tanacetum coccineum]